MATLADVERVLAEQPPDRGVLVYDGAAKEITLLASRPEAPGTGAGVVMVVLDCDEPERPTADRR